jgi:hypothetical protein
MARERGNNEDDEAYEQQWLAQIEINKRKLAALQLPSMSSVEQQGQKKKRSKVCANIVLLQVSCFIKTIHTIMFLCCR